MFGVALLTSALLAVADARIYERCELARDLLSLGIKKDHLATWVCIAFHESRFDTAARNPHSGDHGLLQISELYWCGAGKACGLPCSVLRDDDISDDVECALRIHEEHTRLQGNGFLAWVVYPQHCKHNAKKYLADCDSSVKTPSVRTNARARVLKSQYRNNTSFPYNPKIDELLPPYLAIGSLFQGNYEKEFEKNYSNKKAKVNWLNYKIDNIDDLKLPVLNQKAVATYSTTTLATSTTTTSSPLPKIKPPMPRRIESNSFRRKKILATLEPVQFTEATDVPTTTSRSLLTTIRPRNAYRSTTENLVKQNTLFKFVDKTNVPIITTIKPATKDPDLYSSFPVINSAVAREYTTKAPFPYTVNPIETATAKVPSTEVTNRPSSTTSSLDQSTMLSIDKMKSTFADLKINLSVNQSHYYSLVTPTSILTSSTTAPTITNTKNYFNFERQTTKPTSTTPKPWSRLTWRTPDYKTITISTSSKPLLTTSRTPNPWSSVVEEKNQNVSKIKSQQQLPTSNEWVKSHVNPKPQSLESGLPNTDNNTSSTRTFSIESTTTKPRSATLTSTVHSLTKYPISTPSTVTSTELPSTTSARTYTINTSRTVTPRKLPSSTSARTNAISTSRIVPSTERPSPTTARTSPISTSRTVTSTEDSQPTSARTTQSIFDLYLNPTKRPNIPAFSLPPFKSSGFSLRIFAGGTTTHSPVFTSKSSSPEEPAKNQIRGQAWQNTG